jgi:type V secretory pathway adhesin AidA
MKKCILLFIGVLLFTGASYATDITTHFTTNATLTVDNSPYIIKNNININDGVIVTVEEGVEIKFENGRYLQVFGTLNAYGAKFTSSSGTPTKGIWDGIYVAYENNSFLGSVSLDSFIAEKVLYR